MKKLLMAAILGALILLALSSMATASQIRVLNQGTEELNIQTQGIMTFESPRLQVICNKTMNGKLKETIEGTLGLLRNEAGFIGEIRTANCTNNTTVRILNNLTRFPERVIPLSVLEAPRTLNGGPVSIAGNRAEFLLEAAGGLARCLYRAELVATAEPSVEGRRLYKELTLELLPGKIPTLIDLRGAIACPPPETVTMIGVLRVTKPAGGLGAQLTRV